MKLINNSLLSQLKHKMSNLNSGNLSLPADMTHQIDLLNSSTDDDVNLQEMSLCFNGTALEIVHSPAVQTILVALYLLTSALSLLGNVIVIIVQFYGRGSTQNIRKYLINLALSDLIIGVLCVPFNYTDFVYGHWIFPHWLCPTVQYVQPLCVFITSITLSLIGLERYLFALHPLSCLYRFFQLHNRALLTLTWILGLSYSYVIFGQAQTRELHHHERIYHECVYNSGLSLTQRRVFMSVNFALTFLCPFVLLTFSYLAIMRKLLNGPPFASEQHPQQHTANNTTFSVQMRHPNLSNRRHTIGCQVDYNLETMKNRLKTIKMLMMVILLYALCWLPIKIYQILLEFDQLAFCTRKQFYTLIYAYIVCHWLAMANSFVNPIVYAIMNTSFRYDFWRIVLNLYEYMHSCGRKSEATEVHQFE